MRTKFGFLTVIVLVMTLFITASCGEYDNNSGIESIVEKGSWKIVSLYDESNKEDVVLDSETIFTFGSDMSFTSTGYFRDYSGGTWKLSEENYNTSRGLNCRFESYTNEGATIYIYDGHTKYIAKAVITTATPTEAADTTSTK